MRSTSNKVKSVKLKVCICGKSNETTSVNKDKYRNTRVFSAIGITAFTVGTILVPFRLAQGDQISLKSWLGALITALVIAYLIRYTMREMKRGHSFRCSVRRTFIDFAK